MKLVEIVQELKNAILQAPAESTGREPGKWLLERILKRIILDSHRWNEMDHERQKSSDFGMFRVMSDYNDFLESELGEAILDYYENAVKTGKFDEIVD